MCCANEFGVSLHKEREKCHDLCDEFLGKNPATRPITFKIRSEGEEGNAILAERFKEIEPTKE